MARPNKSRLVCRMPHCQAFFPADSFQTSIEIHLSVEEYEAVRLMDYSNMTQQAAAMQMGVSRATIQGLYAEARKKIARFLVEGTPLKIEGGNYKLCSHGLCCQKRPDYLGGTHMKLAVTYENGQVFQHFGHTEQFKVYEIKEGQILTSEIVNTNGQGHGALAGFLFENGIDALICGGIGGGARNALAEAGITVFPGASGDADAQVASFLQGNLIYDPNTTCHHHEHEATHNCGSNGCGSHKCHP